MGVRLALLKGGGTPGEQGRMGQHGIAVGRGERRQRDVIGVEAAGDGREHRVGRRKRAKQPGAVILRTLAAHLGPDLDDAVDVALHIGLRRFTAEAQLEVHRHGAAQGGKAGVHFGTEAACPRTGAGFARPDRRFALGQCFDDGEAVPDLEAIRLMQAGYAPVPGQRLERRVEGAPGHGDQMLAEGDAEVLHEQPGAERPGGVVFVADIKVVHVRLLGRGAAGFCPQDEVDRRAAA